MSFLIEEFLLFFFDAYHRSGISARPVPQEHEFTLDCSRSVTTRNVVQSLWPEMSVATQHLPIPVPRDECNLLDRETSFEKAAGRLVTQVVKM